MKSFMEAPEDTTFRCMAKMAGKLMSFGVAIPAARLFTKEMYNYIRVEGDWDSVGHITTSMVENMKEVVKWLRPLNMEGAPIRRRAKMFSLRLMVDGSPQGFGARLDGQDRDIRWSRRSLALGAEWTGNAAEAQVHRELLAVGPPRPTSS